MADLTTKSCQPTVLFFGHSARPSGAEIAMHVLCSTMTVFEPIVVLGEEGPIAERCRRSGIKTEIVDMDASLRDARRTSLLRSFGQLRNLAKFRRYVRVLNACIERRNPDVIVSNTVKAHILLSLCKAARRRPVIYYVRDRISRETFSPPNLALVWSLLRWRARLIVANSGSTLGSVPFSKRHLLRTDIPSPIATPSEQSKEQAAHHVRQEIFQFGMAGRLTSWKGQELALRAIAGIVDQAPCQIQFAGGTHFGEESYADELRALSKELGIQNRVEFLGHVDDVYEVMANWDCLVHASTAPEPFGQVIAQGLALGLPIIAANEGGPASILEDQPGSILFEARSQPALEVALVAASRSADLLAAAREAGPLAARLYTSELITPKFETILLEALTTATHSRTVFGSSR